MGSRRAVYVNRIYASTVRSVRMEQGRQEQDPVETIY
jgi:hypothetical protein